MGFDRRHAWLRTMDEVDRGPGKSSSAKAEHSSSAAHAGQPIVDLAPRREVSVDRRRRHADRVSGLFPPVSRSRIA